MTAREDLLIVAHRGASADRPENTREAFLEAARQGSDWVELDARVTCDGDVIVHHDAWYHDGRTVWTTPVGERPPGVPLLEEALDACRELRHMGVNVEIKNTPGDIGGPEVPYSPRAADAVVDLLARRTEAGAADEVLISSFDRATIDRVRELGGPPTGQLTADVRIWPRAVASTAERGHVALHPDQHGVDEALVEDAHAAGLAVNVWTVDAPRRAVALAAMGVDAIITNHPARTRRAVASFVTRR